VPYALLRVLFFQLAFVLASGVEFPVEFLSELFALLSVVEEMLDDLSDLKRRLEVLLNDQCRADRRVAV